jgi:hypothetical protein
MYIENLLSLAISTPGIGINSFDIKIISSFNNQLASGMSFTEKQGNLAVALLKKYEDKLSKIVKQDVRPFLINPKFKLPFRTVNFSKKISIIDHPDYKKAVNVEFPYDEKILASFKQHKSSLNYAHWDKDSKSWIFSLDEATISFLLPLIAEHKFVCDDEFQKYIEQISEIKKNLEKFVPMAVLENDQIKFTNVSEHLPQNFSTDFVESLFNAKKVGITTWDSDIEDKISALPYDDVVKGFIKASPGDNFEINLDENSLNLFRPVFKYILPCLIILDSGRELEKLQQNLEFLTSCDIQPSEISVLFRLPNETNSEFNKFVKDNGLNSPVTDNTKVVFISSQIPKTILGPRKKFNSVLNYYFYTAHYKLKEYLHWQHNVINILDKSPQRRFIS